jgi:hypothetical protein
MIPQKNHSYCQQSDTRITISVCGMYLSGNLLLGLVIIKAMKMTFSGRIRNECSKYNILGTLLFVYATLEDYIADSRSQYEFRKGFHSGVS